MKGVLSLVPFSESGVELQEGIKVLLNLRPYVVDRDLKIHVKADNAEFKPDCKNIMDSLDTILIVCKGTTFLLDYSQWDEALNEKALGKEVNVPEPETMIV